MQQEGGEEGGGVMEVGSHAEVSYLKQETVFHRQEVGLWTCYPGFRAGLRTDHSEEAFTDLLSVWEIKALSFTLCSPYKGWRNYFCPDNKQNGPQDLSFCGLTGSQGPSVWARGHSLQITTGTKRNTNKGAEEKC